MYDLLIVASVHPSIFLLFLLATNSVVHFDEGTKDKPYGHAVVVGIERYPLKVTKAMSQKRIAKRSRVKPFIKTVNYNHFMPTRYALDLDLSQTVNSDISRDPVKRKEARKEVKKLLEERYNAGTSKWFFQKLRF